MRSHATLTRISAKTLSRLLKKRPHISQIHQIHAQIITQSLRNSYISLTDSLIHCYLHTKNLNFARTLFQNYPLPSPPILLWNIMIRAYSKLKNCLEPIDLFRQMVNCEGVVPDEYTFTFVLTSCAQQKLESFGQIVHGWVIKFGFWLSLYVGNSLIEMYGALGRAGDAGKVFDAMPVTDVFSWTSLVSSYSKNGDMSRASDIFEQMPVRNDVSWAVMISGFVSCGMYGEALRFFWEILRALKPNEAVLVCSLSACAHLGCLDQGIQIHDYINENCISNSSNVTTALINMYAKCGRIDSAYQIFNKIPRQDLHNFTSMISGLAIHGLGKDALYVFQQMLDKKLYPNDITILGVLNGCSHSGLVLQGSLIFYNMERLWRLAPKIEHYGSYIDLLGRSGYLAKAFGVVKAMPIRPDVVVWRALLSACRIHRNAEFGERVIHHIEQLDPQNCAGTDVILSNLYASLGKWEKVSLVRKTMVEQKKQSDIGCSWIEIDGVVHEFRVADKIHPIIAEIRDKLGEIFKNLAVDGYIPDATRVSFDLSDEDREQAISLHSEKLAVAFGLMSTSLGVSIRIVKNLRTCEDCHTFLKAVSEVYDREIIVRDRTRFHAFKDGKCSCNDFW